MKSILAGQLDVNVDPVHQAARWHPCGIYQILPKTLNKRKNTTESPCYGNPVQCQDAVACYQKPKCESNYRLQHTLCYGGADGQTIPKIFWLGHEMPN